MKESFSSPKQAALLGSNFMSTNTHLVIQNFPAVPVSKKSKVSLTVNSFALHKHQSKRHWQVPALQVHKFQKNLLYALSTVV